MKSYEYRALDERGVTQDGVVSASSSDAVVAQLRARGLIPVYTRLAAQQGLSASPSRQTQAKISRAATNALLTDLHHMLDAGVSLDQALQDLAAIETKDRRATNLVEHLRSEVREGRSLAAAMSTHAGVFRSIDIGMVRAGEAAGKLPALLAQLVDYRENLDALRQDVINASVYPAILLAVTILSVFAIVLFVLPEFQALFEQSGMLLPWLTASIMTIGDAMLNLWWLLGMTAVLALYGLGRKDVRDALRGATISSASRLPLARDILADFDMSVYLNTLGALTSNGVGIDAASRLTESLILERERRAALAKSHEALRRGQSFVQAIKGVEGIDAPTLSTVLAGERAGNLGPALSKAGKRVEARLRARLKRGLAFVEPVLILVMAMIVGLVVFGLLQAVLGLSEIPG